MIYIITLLVCVFCSLHFDVNGRTHNKELSYRLLLIWFIAVSGLQYMVGSDTPVYMDNYKFLDTASISWKNIVDYGVRYQPGWMLLNYICRFITENFVLLKITIAVFLNVAVFSFFKKNTKYIFTAVLLYAAMDYLVLNFNVLRQSLAVGFSLYAISAIKESKWKSFFILTFMAYMFHDSALLLLSFPLIKFFKPNKYSITCVLVLFFGLIFYLTRVDLNSIMLDVLDSGYMNEDIAQVGQNYFYNDRLGGRDGFAIFSLTRLILLIAIGYYIIYYKETFMGIFGISYILIVIITGFMPILWRYRLYVDFPFIIMMSRVIVELPSRKILSRNRLVAYLIIYSLSIFIFTKDLFSKPPGEKYAAIDQYYPYHSIFNPKINSDQMNYFQSLGN